MCLYMLYILLYICVYVQCHSSVIHLSLNCHLCSPNRVSRKRKTLIRTEWMLGSLFLPVSHVDNPSLKTMWRLCVCYAL